MRPRIVLLALPLLLLCACTKHQIDSRHEIQVAPVEIKPIHITIDVNIRVDKELDNFFEDIDNAQQ